MTTTPKDPMKKNGPDFYAHAVLPNGPRTRIGASIGAAFNHNTGKGFNIILDAMPAPNQYGQYVISCFPPEPK